MKVKGKQHTLCHAEVGPDDEDQFAFLAIVDHLLLLRSGGSAQTLPAIGLLSICPIGRMIHVGEVFLIDVALVALDGVMVKAASLLYKRRCDDVALGGVEAEEVAGDEGDDGGPDDDACLAAVVGFRHDWQLLLAYLGVI